MIKISKGNIQVEGSRAEVLADFTCITHTLIKDYNIPVEKISDSVELAEKSDEELEKELASRIFDKFLDQLWERIKKEGN